MARCLLLMCIALFAVYTCSQVNYFSFWILVILKRQILKLFFFYDLCDCTHSRFVYFLGIGMHYATIYWVLVKVPRAQIHRVAQCVLVLRITGAMLTDGGGCQVIIRKAWPRTIVDNQGRIQDFKLGGALKNNALGYFVWKITIFRQKNHIFPNFSGDAPPPPGSAPDNVFGECR